MFRIVYQIETILNVPLTVNEYVTISGEVVDNSLDIPLLPQNPNFFMGYDAEIV